MDKKVKVFKFWFLTATGDSMPALFKNEEDGHEWGKKHGVEYFKHEPYWTSKSVKETIH